jgi:hypothetical protein
MDALRKQLLTKMIIKDLAKDAGASVEEAERFAGLLGHDEQTAMTIRTPTFSTQIRDQSPRLPCRERLIQSGIFNGPVPEADFYLFRPGKLRLALMYSR